MSKARLVITAVVVQKRPVTEVAADYGVSRSWLYELLTRYRRDGEAAFEPRSRRPRTTPIATSQENVERVLTLRRDLNARGHDAGAETIAWHLARDHDVRALPRDHQPNPVPAAHSDNLEHEAAPRLCGSPSHGFGASSS